LGEREPPANPPVKLEGVTAGFVLRRDGTQERSRILVPKKYLPASEAPTVDLSQDGPQQRTANAGLLLATVISGGGLTVVLLRRRKVGAAIGVLVAMLALTGALGAAMAKVPPPNPPALPRPVVEAQVAVPQVMIEVVETGDDIVLILGRNAPRFGP
jgi:hypothetical protein